MIPESREYCNDGNDYHSVCGGLPYCPKCHAWKDDVIEQGFEHNHRHYCKRCNVVYWIRDV